MLQLDPGDAGTYNESSDEASCSSAGLTVAPIPSSIIAAESSYNVTAFNTGTNYPNITFSTFVSTLSGGNPDVTLTTPIPTMTGASEPASTSSANRVEMGRLLQSWTVSSLVVVFPLAACFYYGFFTALT